MITIKGHGDDIIEIDNDLREEFYVDCDSEVLIAGSDGTRSSRSPTTIGRSHAGSLAPRSTPTATLRATRAGADVPQLLLSGVNPSSPASDSAGKRRSRSRGSTTLRWEEGRD